MDSFEKFGNIEFNDGTYDEYSYISLNESSSVLSPESLLSPSSTSTIMSSPAHQVPQESYSEKMTDVMSNLFYDEGNNAAKKPYLKIIEQPAKKFRFRYKSEMSGTHGCLSGRSRKKSYPTVQLFNYAKDAIIKCSLVQNHMKHEIHPHRLIVCKGDTEVDDPHEILVGSHCKYIARYHNMSILFTGKKSIAGELFKQKKMRLNISMAKEDENSLRISCENEARSINLNSVCLQFTAYDENQKIICNPVYSEPIDNSKSAETCQLKIVNISKTSGSCKGGDKVFIFVEKVNKKNIKIRFFEIVNDERVWEDFATFTELDVHHQFGIVFKTPAYHNLNITQDVNVYIELYRPKDNAISEELSFCYKPMPRQNKKRRLVDDLSSPLLAEDFPHYQLHNQVPLTVQHFSKSNSYTPCANANVHQSTFETQSINKIQPIYSNHENNRRIDTMNIPDQNLIEQLLSELNNDGNNHPFALIDPELLLDNITRDSPKKSVDTSKNKHETPKELQEMDDFMLKHIHVMTKALIQKCQSIYPNIDTKNLLKINVLLTVNKDILKIHKIKTLIKLIEEGLSNGENFLHMLITIDQFDILQSLLHVMTEHKMFDHINSVNRQGETALHRAVNFCRLETIPLLLSQGCNPNIPDENGNSIIHLCIINNSFDCLSAILNYNDVKTDSMPSLDLDVFNNDGFTPLHLAFMGSSLLYIRKMIKAGANVEIKTKNDGRTVLHLAVEQGNLDSLKFIVENTSILINACTYSGYTALHLACVSENKNAPDMCQYLLAHDADPFMKFDKNTAVAIASRNNNHKVSQVINEYIAKDLNVAGQNYSENQFLDDKTIVSVSKLLDKSGKWKDVAEMLGYKSIIPVCEQSKSSTTSPSTILLNSIEMEHNVTVQNLYELLVKLGISDAAKEVKKVIFKN